MPALQNARYELCCQARAAGKTVGEAYVAGGYKYNSASPSQFFQRPAIVARVNEIIAEKHENERRAREIGVQEAGIDEAWICKRLKYLTDISLQGRPIKKDGVLTGELTKPDGAVAAQCLRLAAQMRGLLIQKVEVGDPGDFARMDDTALDATIDRMAAELGYVAPAGQRPATEH